VSTISRVHFHDDIATKPLSLNPVKRSLSFQKPTHGGEDLHPNTLQGHIKMTLQASSIGPLSLQ